MTHHCPTGVSLHRSDTDELTDRRDWTVLLDDGTLARLTLRLARGVVRSETITRERSEG